MVEGENAVLIQPEQVLALLARQAEACTQPAEKAAALMEMGELAERELGDPKKAVGYFTEALSHSPQHVSAWRAIVRAQTRIGAWEEALQARRNLTKALESAKGAQAEIEASRFEEASLLLYRLQRPQDAQQAAKAVLAGNPKHRGARALLEDLTLRAKDWSGLEAVLQGAVAAETETDLRLGLLFRLANLSLEIKDDPETARGYLEEILKTNPGHLASLKMLERIYRKSGNGERRAHVLEQLAAALKDRGEANRILFAAARVWAEEAANPERALSCLETVLRADPKDMQALEFAGRLYEEKEAGAEVKRVLGAELQLLAPDDPRRRSLQSRVAELCVQAGETETAVAMYHEILAQDRRDISALRFLGGFYSQHSQWAKLAALYEGELVGLEDPAAILSVTLRLANLYERSLKDLAQAAKWTAKAYELWPQNPLLRWNLARLLRGLSDWPRLVALLRQELEQTTDLPRKRALLNEIADLSATRVGDADGAVAAYQQLLSIDPKDVTVYERLGNLLESLSRWQELTALLGQQIAQAGHGPEAVALFLKAADIFDQHLQQPQMATNCFQQALALAPQHLPTIQAFGTHLARQRDWAQLVQLYQRELAVTQDPEQQASLYYRVGTLFDRELKQRDQAIACYRYAVHLRPEFLAASEQLLQAYEGNGLWEEWITLMRARAEQVKDPQQRAVHLARLAEIRWRKTGNMEGAKQELLAALQADGKSLPVMMLLSDLFEGAGQWTELSDLLARFSQEVKDPAWRVAVLLWQADIQDQRLGDPAKAVATWEQVLAIDPQQMAAVDRLEDAYRKTDQVQGLAKILQLRLQALLRAQRLDEAVPFYEQLADLVEFRFKDAVKAAPFLQKLLETRPERRDVVERLVRIFTQASRFEDLTELYRRRIQVLSSGGHQSPEVVDLYQDLGFLYEKRLERLPEAISCWEQVRRFQPANLLALKTLERLLLATRDLRQLAELYEAFVPVLRVQEEKVRVLILAGELFAGRLEAPERAQSCFEQAVAIDSTQLKAWEGLKTLYEKANNWESYLRVNESLLKLFEGQKRPTQELAALQKQNGGVLENELQKLDEAAAAFQKAFTLTPRDFDVSQSLVRIHRKLAKWEEVLADYSNWILQIEEPPQAVTLYQERGQVLEERLQKPDYAIVHYEKALAVDPKYLPALGRLSQLRKERCEWKEARRIYESLLEAETDKARSKEAMVALGDVMREGFSDEEGALGQYEKALAIDPAFGAALNRLGDIYEGRKDWKRLIGILETNLKQLPHQETSDAVALRTRLGGLFWTAEKNLDRAVSEYRSALKVDAECLDAQIGLAEVYAQNAEAGYLTQAINEFRRALEIHPTRPETYRALAKIFEKNSQYDKVYCLYRILNLIGLASETEKSFIADNQSKAAKELRGPMSDEDRTRYLVVEEFRTPFRDFFRHFQEGLDKLFKGDLGRFGFKKSDRITPQSKNPLRDACDKVAGAFGMGEYDFYVKDGAAQHEVVNAELLSLVVAGAVINKLNRDEQRFVFGGLCWTMRERLDFLSKGKMTEWATVLRAARKGFQAQAKKADPGFAGEEERIFKELDKSLSRKTRQPAIEYAEKLKPDAERIDEAVIKRAMDRTRWRAGLVCSGDVGTAFSALSKLDPQVAALRMEQADGLHERLSGHPGARELLLYASSDEYFALRRKVGVAIL